MKQIRVLIVDDSAFVRKAIGSMLQSDNRIEIIGYAQNGREAVQMTEELRPDIITMDIEMPIMNGLEALRLIMQQNPTPVIMVSSITFDGAEATIEAMTLGAVDFIPKQSSFNVQNVLKDDLIRKIVEISQSHGLKSRLNHTQSLLNNLRSPASAVNTTSFSPTSPLGVKSPPPAPEKPMSLMERIAARRRGDNNASVKDSPLKPETTRLEQSKTEGRVDSKTKDGDPSTKPSLIRTNFSQQPFIPRATGNAKPTGRKRLSPTHFKIAVLGVSTGGPLALHQVIPKLPANLPVPFLIVQHMPAHFTKSLADRLNSISHLTVCEAKDKDVLEPGKVYIAPGGLHMKLKDNRTILITEEPKDTLHRPAVDTMVDSVLDIYNGNVLGIIMTGMGRDGALALRRLNTLGGYVIAQNEESCIVYGMPKAVVDDGTADEIVHLDELAHHIATSLGVKAVEQKS